MGLYIESDLAGTARFQSITVQCVTNGVLADCGPSCLQMINILILGLSTTFLMIIIPIRGEDLAPGEGDRWSFYICSISDLNTNSCHLLTKLDSGGLVVLSALCTSTMPLTALWSRPNAGEVGMEKNEIDSVFI